MLKIYFLENDALNEETLFNCVSHLFLYVQKNILLIVHPCPELAKFKYTWSIFKLDFFENEASDGKISLSYRLILPINPVLLMISKTAYSIIFYIATQEIYFNLSLCSNLFICV